jgi:hypothetical protein
MLNKSKTPEQESRFNNSLHIELSSADAHFANGSEENPSEIRKMVVVKNGRKPVRDCQVILKDLQYHFRNEWILPPNGYEQKALRWVEEYDHLDGKINILANRSTILEIARGFRFPNPYFGIAYFDGSYGKTHHFVGTYKLQLRIEGKVCNSRNLWEFKTVCYEIYLNYVGALDLEIGEIIRTNAS